MLAFVLCQLLVKGQLPDYHLQLFDYTSGIRPGNILSVSKDTRGFLWILYPRQIQRFDGNYINTYKLPEAFNHMLCDDAGRIWLSSAQKILLYSDSSDSFKEINLQHTHNFQLGPIIQTADHRIMVIASNGIMEFEAKRNGFISAFSNTNNTDRYSTRFFGSYGTSLFYRNDVSLFRYDMKSGQLDSLPNLEIYKLHPLHYDSVLVSTWTNKSYWYNFKNKTTLPVNLTGSSRQSQHSSLDIKSMARYSPHEYFLTTSEGIFAYNATQKQFKRLNLNLNGRKLATNDFANHIYVDNEGFAWMSTVEGIVRFSFNRPSIGLMRIRQLNDDLPVAIDNVRRIVSDKNNNLWLATGSGFAGWNAVKKEWSVFLATPGATNKLAHPSIRGLVYDGRNLILGPTDLGLWIFNPETQQYKRPKYKSTELQKLSERDFVDEITTLNNGNHLVMGRDALYLLNGKTYELSAVDIPAAKENCNFAFQGKNGTIWLTTNKGLHFLDASLNNQQTVPLPFGNKYISCGFVMADDKLLFSTVDGLYTARVENGSAVLEKFTNEFDNIFLTSIYVDQRGVIWATSENGIYRFDPVTRKLNLFDHSDNVQGYGFNPNAWYQDEKGILYFGGANGVNYLQPESFESTKEALKVYITHIRSNDNDSLLNSAGSHAINYSFQGALQVEFVSPYFNNPEKVKYRYMLSGFDYNWKNIGNVNTIQFTSLPPGTYTLYIQASINNVDWVSANNSFTFNITPPFWLRWWFIALVVLVVGGIIWQIARVRTRKIRQQKEQLEAEQAINYFASSIQDGGSVQSILWDVAKNCIGRLQFEDCVIYLVDYKNRQLVQKAAYGPKSPDMMEIKQPIKIPLGKGITGHVALTGKAEIVRDTSKDPRYIVDDAIRYSEITVPIVYNGRVLGIIDCEHSKKGFFTQKHLSILNTIASLCANKIVKARAEKQKQLAEKILMDTQRKMADVEMQALRAQMNPHFIFNCLNSINRYIVKSDQITASLYLTKFAKLIRLILDNSNSKYVTLTNELEALRLYIEMESIRFEKQFTYEIKVEDEVQSDSIYVPPLIIQPYVENAIWHGLLHKETAGKLQISVEMLSESMLQCTIEDNGIGRKKASELRSKSASTKKSLGMKLTEDRLALLGKKAHVFASVEVEDMVDCAGDAQGTKVIIKIPIDS